MLRSKSQVHLPHVPGVRDRLGGVQDHFTLSSVIVYLQLESALVMIHGGHP